MRTERSLIIIKPDAVERGLVGQIIKHFEKTSIHIKAIKIMKLDKKKAEDFYAEHEGKSFFEELVSYIISAPIVAMIIEGENCVEKARKIIGKTNPLEADEGTIRKMYAISRDKNSIHASDSRYAALRELGCLFDQDVDQVA
ncbi:MAG: nucleoside-diphosphate kinase [bacterium]